MRPADVDRGRKGHAAQRHAPCNLHRRQGLQAGHRAAGNVETRTGAVRLRGAVAVDAKTFKRQARLHLEAGLVQNDAGPQRSAAAKAVEIALCLGVITCLVALRRSFEAENAGLEVLEQDTLAGTAIDHALDRVAGGRAAITDIDRLVEVGDRRTRSRPRLQLVVDTGRKSTE